MRSLNKAMLIGNVGRDPEVQITPSGKKVAHISLATSRRIQLDRGYEERTDWHRLTMWDKLAQFAEDYIRKGDRVFVEGRIEYGSFEKNGQPIPTTEIVVNELILLGTPGGNRGDDEQERPKTASARNRSTPRRTRPRRRTPDYYAPRRNG